MCLIERDASEIKDICPRKVDLGSRLTLDA